MSKLNLEWIKRPPVFGTIIGVVVIALIWWLAFMSPEGAKLTSISSQQATAQSQVLGLEMQIAQLQHESKQLQKELPYLAFFQAQIPPLPDQGNLTKQLYELSLRTKTFISQLSDSNLTPPAAAAAAAAAAASYSTMPITIQVSGTHNGITAFLQGLYTLQRLVTIQQVSLTPPTSAPNLNTNAQVGGFGASITATAYTSYVPAVPAVPVPPAATVTSST